MNKLRDILKDLIKAQAGDPGDNFVFEQLSLDQAEREIRKMFKRR